MARPVGATGVKTQDFLKRFEEYSRTYVDPMELLFQIAAKHKNAGKSWDNSHRLSAASTLMSYRYPRLKALEITDATETPKIQISWLDSDGEQVQPPPQALLDLH